MKTVASILLILCICATVEAEKPNVIIVQAADLAINDISFHNQEVPQTRAIDSIFANGVGFGRAYSTSPDNVPSRFALITGIYPQKHGIEANPRDEHKDFTTKFWPKEAKSIGYYGTLAGYETGYFGDWEFGFDAGELPWENGFDYYCGALARIDSYYAKPGGSMIHKVIEMPGKIDVPIQKDSYVPDVLTDKLIEYIDNHKTQSFMTYVSYTAPAWSEFMQAPGKYYQGIEHLPQARKDHMAHVIALDMAIGRIMTKLKETGLYDNTIVVLTSTNGHRKVDGSKDGRPLLRGGKMTLYEGGLRIPILMQWPAKWPKQVLSDHLVSVLDIIPTVMEAMGAKRNIWDGKSLTGIILNPSKADHHAMLHFRYMGQLATVTPRFKIMHSLIVDSAEVYDLKDDPFEKNNIFHRSQALANRAMEECRKWNLDNKDVELIDEGQKFAVNQKYVEFNLKR